MVNYLFNGSDVEVSDANGVVVTLIGLGDVTQALMSNSLECNGFKLWRRWCKVFNWNNCDIRLYLFRGLRSGSSFIYDRYTGPNKHIQAPRVWKDWGETNR